jgi:hypothetical protein
VPRPRGFARFAAVDNRETLPGTAEGRPEGLQAVATDGKEAVDGRGELDFVLLSVVAEADFQDAVEVDGVAAVNPDEAEKLTYGVDLAEPADIPQRPGAGAEKQRVAADGLEVVEPVGIDDPSEAVGNVQEYLYHGYPFIFLFAGGRDHSPRSKRHPRNARNSIHKE